MRHTHDILRARLLQRAGVTPPAPPPFSRQQVEALWESERLPRFDQLRLNRLVMGALRYGPMAGSHHDSYGYDPDLITGPWLDQGGSRRIQSAINRLEDYQRFGNAEHLLDAANLCGIEFEYGNHPLKHFKPLDRSDS